MAKTLRIKNLRDIQSRKKLGAKVKLCDHNTAFQGRIGVMRITLPPLGCLLEHRHEKSESLLLILRGEGKLTYGQRRKEVLLHAEDIVNIPARTWHSLTANEKGLQYLAVQDPAVQFQGGILDTTLRGKMEGKRRKVKRVRKQAEPVG